MNIQAQKLHPDAIIPRQPRAGDAGIDLCSIEDAVIPPHDRRTVRTGLAMAIPTGNVGLVWDRSGLAHKEGITILAGVIDAGYRGEIMVVMFNSSSREKSVKRGDRIAQMLIQPVFRPNIEEVEHLPDSERGALGLGSSGL